MKPGIGPDYHHVVSQDATTRMMKNGSRLAQRSARTQIDVAVGVLIALCGCSEAQCFQRIADAVRDTGVGLSGVCHALISLVSGGTDTRADPTALNHWRHTIDQLAHAGTASAGNSKGRLGD